jgi:hypothetical protein
LDYCIFAGHAGLFHPNQSTQPACPCPTESYPLNSTSNSKPPQQLQSVSSDSLLALEVGAKHPKSQSQQALVSVTATRPSRHSSKDVPTHPPTCITPAVAADPPVTIQLLNSNVNVQQTQDRQLESAKTFTEQYSLPDDITITPIIVSNANTNALLLMNSSISIVTTSAPSATSEGNNNLYSGTDSNSSSKGPIIGGINKKKEKDIVHLIDPRSGHKTTIAKHISNKNLFANRGSNSPTKSRSKSPPKERSSPGQSGSAVSRLKSNINKLGSIKVGKLNPDLDVIVINNNGSNIGGSAGNGNDHIAQNGNLIQQEHMQQQQYHQQPKKSTNKVGPVSHNSPDKDLTSSIPSHSSQHQQVMYSSNSTKSPGPKGNRGQIVPRRIALVGNDNNSQRKLMSNKRPVLGQSPEKSFQPPNPSFNYSLPPGISISAGVGTNLSITPSTNLHNQHLNVRPPMTVQNYQNKSESHKAFQSHQVLANQNSANSKPGKGNGPSSNKKRISLNECIDGLQKKRMKLLEDHDFTGDGTNPTELINGGGRVTHNPSFVPAPNGRMNKSSIVFPFDKASLPRSKVGGIGNDAGATAARVRDPEEFNMGSTVINSSDAIVAVSAVVVDPETYHLIRNARAAAAMTAAVKGGQQNKNGLKKTNSTNSKFHGQQGSRKAMLHGKKVGVGSLKVKVKGLEKVGGGGGTRSTRSSAANAKIRTRLSTKPKLSGDSSGLNSRSRSRLLRIRNPMAGNARKSESECSSTNTSRSSSAARFPGGNGASGRAERGNRQAAFINAVADFYQYRRNVMLRVPKAGVGIFPSASCVNLLNIPGSSSSASSTSIKRGASVSPGQERPVKALLNPPSALSPGNSQNILSPQLASGYGAGNSSRSNSPSLPNAMGTASLKSPVGSMAAGAAKKRAIVKPLSPSAVNGALLQLGAARRQPKWSNGWRFEGEPYEARVLVNVSESI